MPITFEGQISKDEFTHIFTLAFQSMLWLTYFCGPLFVILTGALIISIFREAFNPSLLLGVIFFGTMASYPLWGPSSFAQRVYKHQEEIRDLFAGSINAEEIILRTANTSLTVKWAIYKKFVRDENVVLLYQNSRFFNYFPRTVFASDEDWQDFQALLNEKVHQGELKEMTGRFDLTLGSGLPRWLTITVIVVIGLPVVCSVLGLIIILIYRNAQ
jgi:hypothetical protein